MGSITIRALCPRCTKNIPHLVYKKHRLTIECKCNYKGLFKRLSIEDAVL